MATLPNRDKRPYNGIYRSPKSSKLFNYQSLEPTPNKMGTTTVKLQFQDYIQTRKTGRKTRRIKETTGVSSSGESYASRTVYTETGPFPNFFSPNRT